MAGLEVLRKAVATTQTIDILPRYLPSANACQSASEEEIGTLTILE
jgi:hypothetical protein